MSRIDDMVDEVGADYDANALPGSFVGIPKTTIANGAANFLVEVPVLRNFRPDRLILSAAAQVLDVYDIKIATTTLNVGKNPVPGNIFAPDSVNVKVRCQETATPALAIQLFVGNDTGAGVVLKGAFLGPYVP